MEKYKFKVSRQAKAWFDDIVSVEANSREEAEEILREEAEEGTYGLWSTDVELEESNVDYDTVEYLESIKIELIKGE